MKVFISVDMEGVAGLVRWADVITRGIDFARNRGFMTQVTASKSCATSCSMPEFEIAGDRAVRTEAPDMDLGFRRIAYLGYAQQPGMIRY